MSHDKLKQISSHTAEAASRNIQRVIYLPIMLTLFVLLILGSFDPARAVSSLYPDLKTLPPTDLQLSTELISGSGHWVLRFSNTVWNAGEGTLEMRGETVSANKTKVYQRIYDDGGGFSEVLVGEFNFHESHNHWHFDDFAEYELWTRTEYDQWLANGRQNGQAQRRGSKTTFCIIDTGKVENLPGSPASAQYDLCGQELQGLSVGWGDTYGYYLPDQWIDLGPESLPNGDYVLRSIADPKDAITESGGGDSLREGAEANEAVTFFSVKGNKVRVERNKGNGNGGNGGNGNGNGRGR